MNLPTILVGLVVLGIFGAIVVRGIRNWKAGKHSCGGNCEKCHACSCCGGNSCQ